MNRTTLMNRIYERMLAPHGPGLNTVIRKSYREVVGVDPSDEEFRRVAREFDVIWSERFNPPISTAMGLGPFAQGTGGGRCVSTSKDNKTRS
jgi:hypothetical protein